MVCPGEIGRGWSVGEEFASTGTHALRCVLEAEVEYVGLVGGYLAKGRSAECDGEGEMEGKPGFADTRLTREQGKADGQ